MQTCEACCNTECHAVGVSARGVHSTSVGSRAEPRSWLLQFCVARNWRQNRAYAPTGAAPSGSVVGRVACLLARTDGRR
jgi:hypothetical protein